MVDNVRNGYSSFPSTLEVLRYSFVNSLNYKLKGHFINRPFFILRKEETFKIKPFLNEALI